MIPMLLEDMPPILSQEQLEDEMLADLLPESILIRSN